MSRNKTSEYQYTHTFSELLQNFFLSYLIGQRKRSSNTVASYSDTYRLYLEFLLKEHGIKAEDVEMQHLQLSYIAEFKKYLEDKRCCCPNTINQRLSAIKSFLRYAAIEAPEYNDFIRKAMTSPKMESDKPVITFITKDEYESMLSACDENTQLGKRDGLILMILYNTGCRVSELTGLKINDIRDLNNKQKTVYLCFYGKGRKERQTPVWKSTAKYLRGYISECGLQSDDYLLKGIRGERLTRSGVSQRIRVIVSRASDFCPSLKEKNISPHVFRHSTALNLLQSGVDISTVAIWLGHESIETTHKYMSADLDLKRKAMEKMGTGTGKSYHYKPSPDILEFLKSL